MPDILVLITGHFGLFKTLTLRLGEAGTIQTQSQTQRLTIAKTNFKSVRKTIDTMSSFLKWWGQIDKVRTFLLNQENIEKLKIFFHITT